MSDSEPGADIREGDTVSFQLARDKLSKRPRAIFVRIIERAAAVRRATRHLGVCDIGRTLC